MKIFFGAFSCLVLSTFLSIFAEAKEWRGIAPFKSTRSDVTRILGKTQADSIRARYKLQEGEVTIYFSNQKIIPINCVKKLPDDTVLFIRFEPKGNLLLSDLKVDLNKFKTFYPAKPNRVYDGYLNAKEGLVIRAYKNEVKVIVYFAKSKKQKQCPEFYPNPEDFVRTIVN